MKIRSVIILILALGLFWSGVPRLFAHNIDVAKARDKAREYAKQKVADPNRAYEHFTTDCLAAFPGHNHYVRCSIFYFDESRKQLCKERIEVYLPEHHMAKFPDLGTVQELTYNLKHTSTKEC